MPDRGPEIGPGEVVGEKYRVIRELGRGGMGVVLAADHLLLGHPVALKVMLRSGDERALERFRREARIVVKLQSQHVCKVFDVGALADGTPFMVMELLEGETLREVSRRRGWLGIESAVDAILQASEAIAEAHSMGVVHRDLKPENLFATRGVDGQPIIKVLDFGISKIFSDGGHTLTETGELLGSPRFMAPEQLQRHREVDLRADIWALGVVLYELLTGQPAFRARNMAELLVFILQDDPDPIAAFRPEVSEQLADVVARCLEKDADRRFANVAELAIALGPFASDHGRPYVDRICHVASAGGWSPSLVSSAPPTVVDRRPPSTTAISAPMGSTAATREVDIQDLERRGAETQDVVPAVPRDRAARSMLPATTLPSLGRTAAPPAPRAWLGAAIAAAVALAVLLIGAVFQAAGEGASEAKDADEPKDARGLAREDDGDVSPRRSATSAPLPRASLFPSAPELIQDAMKRNGDSRMLRAVHLYPSLLQVEMQQPDHATRVQRHSYDANGFTETKTLMLSDGDRAELPRRLFSPREVRFERLPRMIDEAPSRAGDPTASVEWVTVERQHVSYSREKKKWIEDYVHVTIRVGVALSGGRAEVEYWGEGTLRCVSLDEEGRHDCPENP